MPQLGPRSALVGWFLAVGCRSTGPTEGAAPSASSGALVAPAVSGAAAAPASGSSLPAPAPATSLGVSPRCPEDMRLVDGNLCPNVEQRCLEHHPEYEKNKDVSERCLRYAEPSRCLSEARKHIAVCIDTYEWPNRVGELPRTLTQWTEAVKMCESVGKRLCDEEEWLLACEGEAMLPHVYGYTRDTKKCNIDQPYRERKHGFLRWDRCMANDKCKAHFDELDQREPSGSRAECVSPFGAFDMNGNVNEWVNRPGKKYPDRSGLKGGWWGPVRNRCRPTVDFHKEDDWGYEAGFRCCKAPTP